MTPHTLKQPLVLCSGSPRRQELLSQLGFEFRIYAEEVDESFPDDLPATQVAEFLAKKKNTAYRHALKEQLLLTADTTVVIDGKVLNKPSSHQEAESMLKSLSGRQHQVISGFCLSSQDQIVSGADVTDVTFSSLTKDEIDFYIQNYKPMDKAGAYGIQEWIGLAKIASIRGSYFNVMGLPTHLIYKALYEQFSL